jgi:hypothetical protein
MIEKDLIMSDTMMGEGEEKRKASVACRFIDFMAENLNQRVARAWSRMDEFLELFYAFGVYSPDEIVADGPGYTNSEPMP